MSKEQLLKYLETQYTFTVAEVQQKFGVDYGLVRQVVKELENAGKIYLESGITFKWVIGKPILEEHIEYTDKLDGSGSEDDVDGIDINVDLDDLFDLDDDDDEDDDDDAPLTWKTVSPATPAQAIVDKLAVFGINVKLCDTVVGASVTRYIFNIISKTRVSDIQKLADDIASCTASSYPVRIVESVGNNVAIEVANTVKDVVTLNDIITSKQFNKSNGKLDFVLGEDVARNKIIVDLADLPHLLVAGTTGSGKSCVLSNIIISLAHKYSPDYVQFMLVDPKFVELSRFNGLPHLINGETITNHADTLACLDYLINEMERRYMLMRDSSSWNIVDYNKRASKALPYIVFIVDELADIMYECKSEFELKIQRLAQKSRAAGIHIVLATQRPDVRTITGTIKANLPARVALKMASVFDSHTVIGGSGCERLVGSGDMLYLSPATYAIERIQGAYISNEDIIKFVNSLKKKYPCNTASKQQADKKAVVTDADIDPLCKRALRFWLEKQNGKASIASIQRNLGIGYNRAGRIVETLQKLGYIEEYDNNQPFSRPLHVLVKLDELDLLFPNISD